MKQRAKKQEATPGHLIRPAATFSPSDAEKASRGGDGGRKVLALISLNLGGYLFSADYPSGKKAEITSRVAANFVGWERDHALFDRELQKVIRALKTDDAGREKPPPPKL